MMRNLFESSTRSVRRFVLSALCLPVLSLAACTAPVADAPTTVPDFDAALAAHISAVQSRDLDAYLDTITTDDALTLIFPNGTLVPTRDGVVAFHESWFEDPEWRISFEPVSRLIGETLAVVIMRVGYRDTPDGADRFNYLTLVFRLEDGTWRLVHDQNTPIPADTPTSTEAED